MKEIYGASENCIVFPEDRGLSLPGCGAGEGAKISIGFHFQGIDKIINKHIVFLSFTQPFLSKGFTRKSVKLFSKHFLRGSFSPHFS